MQVTEQVRRLLETLSKAPTGTRDLMHVLELRHRPTFLYDYLQPARAANLSDMTPPASPKSPTQKYRLTVRGTPLAATVRTRRET